MDEDWGGLVAAYEAGLQRYVDAGDEVELEAACAFSREAFGAEMTILDVVDVHRARSSGSWVERRLLTSS